jgi:hypothetical protein
MSSTKKTAPGNELTVVPLSGPTLPDFPSASSVKKNKNKKKNKFDLTHGSKRKEVYRKLATETLANLDETYTKTWDASVGKFQEFMNTNERIFSIDLREAQSGERAAVLDFIEFLRFTKKYKMMVDERNRSDLGVAYDKIRLVFHQPVPWIAQSVSEEGQETDEVTVDKIGRYCGSDSDDDSDNGNDSE